MENVHLVIIVVAAGAFLAVLLRRIVVLVVFGDVVQPSLSRRAANARDAANAVRIIVVPEDETVDAPGRRLRCVPGNEAGTAANGRCVVNLPRRVLLPRRGSFVSVLRSAVIRPISRLRVSAFGRWDACCD